MSEETILEGEETPIEVNDELSAEEKERNEKTDIIISGAQDLAKKIFDDNIAGSELQFASVELIPQFLDSYIKILKGKSKKWEVVVKAQSDFFETKIKDLDLYEETEE